MNLNAFQRRAIELRAPSICVVAGPGSGKTRTLVERVFAIEAEHRFQRSRVILTFTNAGAHELSVRLRGVRCEFLGTLHGYCFRLLQRHGTRLGYREGGVNLIDADAAETLLKTIAGTMGWRKSMKKLHAKECHDSKQIWFEYAHQLKRNNIVDYDGVLVAAGKLLSLEEVRAAESVDELYVDEAQDSAQIDWFIYHLIPAGCKFVVGDPDQGIYAFRGAWPQGFREFEKNAETVYMELNYRSGMAICGAASRLIGHNTDRLQKDVLPALNHAGSVTVTRAIDETNEGQTILGRIRALTSDLGGRNPDDIAILCRRNRGSGGVQEFRELLAGAGIPVAGEGKTLPVDPRDWKHGIDVLCLFNDPRNDLIAERVIAAVAGQEKVPALKSAALVSGNWLGDQARRDGVLPLTILDNQISSLPGVLGKWKVSTPMIELVQQRIQLLPQAQPLLQDLLHDLFNHEQWTPGEEVPGVTVSTLHGAKGREWPVVFMPGVEEKTLPTIRADSTATDIEEERRLFYVGLTRAEDELHISWALARFEWTKKNPKQPSRFITEAGLL